MKLIHTITITLFCLSGVWTSIGFSQTDINQKLERLDFETSGLKEIIELFGKPKSYNWNNQTYQKSNLPSVYIASYPNGLQFVLSKGKINEVRHEGPTGYRFKGKLQVGSSLEAALEVLGQPTQTVSGKANKHADGVLYKDIDGTKGYCYYQRSDQNVRLFFASDKITALYITNPLTNKKSGSGSSSIRAVKPIDNVDYYDDVRYKDMSNIKTLKNDIVRTLRFNQDTVWPQQSIGSKTIDWFAGKTLQSAMNPGLGVRNLHKMGITGKGVNVAIIDQPMYLDHPEFKGKITAYHDLGCGSKSSMHGPAVASLLVGENCGTAPEARVFYVAAPSWTKDTAFQAQALEWIIDKNRQLPIGQKIRVVSVSACPSGPGSPFDKNNQMWDQACQKAEGEGIMVLDCTRSHRGFISPAHFIDNKIENPASCSPGYPKNSWQGSFDKVSIFVPTCPRTSAEEYDEGKCTYAYWGEGGLSWAIPYAAGVLAMGWQVWPEASPEQMKELLLQSAYINKDGARIISPPRFIKTVKKERIESHK